MTFSNIFDRIGSKLIGLKFVGSSISPNLWIGCMDQVFAVMQICEKVSSKWERCVLGVYGLGKGI